MIMTCIVDQRRSFEAMVFLSCEPKIDFQTKAQAVTKGTEPKRKWEVQVLVAVRDQFGNLSNEVLKVGIDGHRNPGEGIGNFTPVELGDLTFGVMEKTKKDQHGNEKIIGVNVWFRCSEIKLAGQFANAPATDEAA